MKKLTIVLPVMWIFSGCQNVSVKDRDVFSLTNDLTEISKHAEKQKSVPDMDMLLRVSLPPDPTHSEVINYINVIYTLSRNQKSYLDSDPQIGMLTKLGRTHIPLILQTSKPEVQWTKYGTHAVSLLAQEQDKKLILSELRNNYNLAKVVLDHGWCVDAENILVELISSSSGYLPSEVIQCLVQLKKSELYPALKNYMIEGWNSHVTYKLIKHLPGIDLTESLQSAWEASRNNHYQIAYLTPDTLASGYLPAFHFLFETIDDNYRVPNSIYDAEVLIKRFSNLSGDKTTLKKWYSEHLQDIVFDRQSGKFVLASFGLSNNGHPKQ